MGEGRLPASPSAMSCISWNCLGLGRPRAVRALKDLIRPHKPMILGLIETKLKVTEWDLLRVTLGFKCCFAVGSRGCAGGLALLWNNESEVTLKSYSHSILMLRWPMSDLLERPSSTETPKFI